MSVSSMPFSIQRRNPLGLSRLVFVIIHPLSWPTTSQVMIQLLGLLGVNAANIPAIVEKGGMDICFNLAQKEDTKKGIVRQAIMTIEKMSSKLLKGFINSYSQMIR